MDTGEFIRRGLAGVVLVLVHMQAYRLRFMDAEPRSRWLSASGGVAVAYIFVSLLPELAHAQTHLEGLGPLYWLERHVYMLALLGLLVFHGIELHVRQHRRRAEDAQASTAMFWVHIASFCVYNALIGYILVTGTQPLIAYSVAVGLHFLVIDHGLRVHHPRQYRTAGRYAVSFAILAGWLAGALTHLPQAFVAIVTGFVGGAVMLNVLKEELPEEKESSVPAFVIGAVAYSILLLAVETG